MVITKALRGGVLLIALALSAQPIAAGAADEAPRITKEEARKLLDAPKVVFVDARTESSWYSSDQKIKGAVRIDKWDLGMWTSSYPEDTTFIVY